MNPYDLAWKGKTVKDKQELLVWSIKERDRLILDGKIKDAQLGLASTCVDIINTAESQLKDKANLEENEWTGLLNKASDLAKEAVELVLKEKKSDWKPSDYEVAGVIILKTSTNNDGNKLAKELFDEGLKSAVETKDEVEELLIIGQIIRLNISEKNKEAIISASRNLQEKLIQSKSLDPKYSTRLYRALAEGYKFLAIQFAIDAQSENQEIKARGI